MKTRLLFVVSWMMVFAIANASPSSRLQFATPDGWNRTIDPKTQLFLVTPPGGGAAVTFAASVKFAGSAEQWQHAMWSDILKTIKLAGPSQPGAAGPFLSRMGVIEAADGSHPWICLYSRVDGGRGEAAIYFAADEKTFFAHLGAVTRMIQNTTIATGAEAKAGGVAESPSPNVAANVVPSAAPVVAPDASTTPVLAYAEPAGFYRSAIQPPTSYTSNETNAGFEVYPFRPFTGDIVATFRRTLLADWIASASRETALAGAPEFFDTHVTGATTAFAARFHENNYGQLNERMRMLVVVGNQAAIVDLHASSTQGWNMVGPRLGAMLDSLRIERAAAPPSLAAGPGLGANAVAGLYMTMRSKYVVNLNRSPGYGDTKLALHYYVFSPDGRVYCCYDFPPGGDERTWRQFNFDAAQRADPENTGRYRVDGNQLLIQMSNQGAPVVTARIKDANHLALESLTYERQQ